MHNDAAPSSPPQPSGSGAPGRYYKLTSLSYKWCKKLHKQLPDVPLLTPLDLQRLQASLEPKRWFPVQAASNAHQPHAEASSSRANQVGVDAQRSKAIEADFQEVRRALLDNRASPEAEADTEADAIAVYLASLPDGAVTMVLPSTSLHRILFALFPQWTQSTAGLAALLALQSHVAPTDTFVWNAPQAEADAKASTASMSSTSPLSVLASSLPLPPTLLAGARTLSSAPSRFLVRSMTDYKRVSKHASSINKAIDQHHSTVRGGAEFEQVRQIWQRGGCAFVSIDTESWERGEATDIIEIGWSVLRRPRASLQGDRALAWTQTTQHRIVSENLGCANGRFVPDNRGAFLYGEAVEVAARTADDFVRPKASASTAARVRTNDDSVSWQSGTVWPNATQIRDLDAIAAELDDTLRALEAEGEVYVVFHDYSADVKVLHHLGLTTTAWRCIWDTHSKAKADVEDKGKGLKAEAEEDDAEKDEDEEGDPIFLPLPSVPATVVDTRRLFAVLENRSLKNGSNLGRMTAALSGLDPVAACHNAANDAFYTLLCLGVMASGPPLPQHRLKVEHKLEALEKKRALELEARKQRRAAWSQGKGQGQAEGGGKRKHPANGWE
ncbi:hypothetical protein ACQY0O_004939 [Thecaphora frezii]